MTCDFENASVFFCIRNSLATHIKFTQDKIQIFLEHVTSIPISLELKTDQSCKQITK